MAAAAKTALEALHNTLATEFNKILSEGVWVKDEEGVARKLTPASAYLNVVRQFLKDNSIESPVVTPGSTVGSIVEKLPFAGAGRTMPDDTDTAEPPTLTH
jgi:hypothetical protein